MYKTILDHKKLTSYNRIIHMNPLSLGTEPMSEDLYRTRTLIAAIIRQAVDDVKAKPPGKRSKSNRSVDEYENDKQTAVDFLVSEACRSYFKFLHIDRDNALTALGLDMEMIRHDKDRLAYELDDEIADYFDELDRKEGVRNSYAKPTE